MAHAEGLGIERERFQACLGGQAAEKVAADLEEGRRLAVTGTPAFFLGTVADDGTVHLKKRINGLVPFDVLAREVEAVRAASTPERRAAASGIVIEGRGERSDLLAP